MTAKRTPVRPEDDWRGASIDQVADLRVWARQRVSQRDADALAQWLLGLTPDAEPRVSRRRLRFFRRLLSGYGTPRTVPLAPDATADLAADPVVGAQPDEFRDDEPDGRSRTPRDADKAPAEASDAVVEGPAPGGARGGGFGRRRT